MRTINLLENLKKHPTFRLVDIERITKTNKNYAKTKINRLIKAKDVSCVSKGIYTVSSNIEEIASNIVYPSYISSWYASYYKGYTEQIVNKITIFTTIKKSLIKYNRYKINFVKTKHMFGYIKQDNIFIVDDNKLLIDVYLKPKEIGNIDEIIKIVKKGNFNKNKIIEYLKKINKKSLVKKIGYLLERYRNIDICNNFKIDKNYVLLNPFSKKTTKTNTKWRVKI